MEVTGSIATTMARVGPQARQASHFFAAGLPRMGNSAWAMRGEAKRAAPVLLWSLVMAAALLAFFVHLLNEQIQRGQQLREQQRAAATRTVPTAAAGQFQPVNLLIASRQPLTRR